MSSCRATNANLFGAGALASDRLFGLGYGRRHPRWLAEYLEMSRDPIGWVDGSERRRRAEIDRVLGMG
jgi:hypothetical protein